MVAWKLLHIGDPRGARGIAYYKKNLEVSCFRKMFAIATPIFCRGPDTFLPRYHQMTWVILFIYNCASIVELNFNLDLFEPIASWPWPCIYYTLAWNPGLYRLNWGSYTDGKAVKILSCLSSVLKLCACNFWLILCYDLCYTITAWLECNMKIFLQEKIHIERGRSSSSIWIFECK